MRRSLLLFFALAGLAFAPHGIAPVRTGSALPCLEAPDINLPGDAPDDGPDDHSAAPSHDALSASDAPTDASSDAPTGGAALAGVALTEVPPQVTPSIRIPRQRPRTERTRLGGRVAAFATVDPPPIS